MNDMIIDKKLSCCSLMKSMSISDYLSFVDNVYEKKGGIQGQRDALKQKTAITIRDRMIKDISEGAILPPIVIGIIVNDDRYEQITSGNSDDIEIADFIQSIDKNNISIIDGMQRTTTITLIIHSLQYLVKLILKLGSCRFHQLFMVESLLDIVLRHQDRLTDVHISYRKQITVILEKYVVTVLDNSRPDIFYKLLNLDTLIQTAHHSNTEIFKYLAAVITKIFKLRQYLIKRIDLFFFRSRQKFILINRPHDTHGAVFFIYTV